MSDPVHIKYVIPGIMRDDRKHEARPEPKPDSCIGCLSEPRATRSEFCVECLDAASRQHEFE